MTSYHDWVMSQYSGNFKLSGKYVPLVTEILHGVAKDHSTFLKINELMERAFNAATEIAANGENEGPLLIGKTYSYYLEETFGNAIDVKILAYIPELSQYVAYSKAFKNSVRLLITDEYSQMAIQK